MDSIGSTGGKSGKLFPVVAGKPRRHMTCPGGIYQVLLCGLDLQTTRFAVPLSKSCDAWLGRLSTGGCRGENSFFSPTQNGVKKLVYSSHPSELCRQLIMRFLSVLDIDQCMHGLYSMRCTLPAEHVFILAATRCHISSPVRFRQT